MCPVAGVGGAAMTQQELFPRDYEAVFVRMLREALKDEAFILEHLGLLRPAPEQQALFEEDINDDPL